MKIEMRDEGDYIVCVQRNSAGIEVTTRARKDGTVLHVDVSGAPNKLVALQLLAETVGGFLAGLENLGLGRECELCKAGLHDTGFSHDTN